MEVAEDETVIYRKRFGYCFFKSYSPYAICFVKAFLICFQEIGDADGA